MSISKLTLFPFEQVEEPKTSSVVYGQHQLPIIDFKVSTGARLIVQFLSLGT